MLTVSCRNRRSSSARRLRQSGKSISSTITSPLTFRGRLQVGRNAFETAGQVFLHTVEILPPKRPAGVVRAGKQDVDEVIGDRSMKSVNDCKDTAFLCLAGN